MNDTSLKTVALLFMNGGWRAIENNKWKMFYRNQIRQIKIDALIGLTIHKNNEVI